MKIWNPVEPFSISSLLEKNKVSMESYFNASAVLTSRHTVVLKRNPDDSFMNNYNPVFLKAWRVYTDIQLVPDTYACVMYVTSYLCKSERTMSQLLQQTSKESKKRNITIKDSLRVLGNVFHLMKPYILCYQ